MAIESQGTKLELKGIATDAVTITDIIPGYPTILTAVEHGLTRGEVVTLSDFAGDDAATINDKVAVVQFVTDDTFAVAIDTTDLTITDNTDQAEVTPSLWTNIGEVADINREDPGANEIDCTHLLSTSREYLMGLQDSGTYTMTVNFLFADAGQIALRAAKTDRTRVTFRVTYPDNSTMTFNGYVQSFSGPAASVDDKLVGDIGIKIDGDITIA